MTSSYLIEDLDFLSLERKGGMSLIKQATLKSSGEKCAVKISRGENTSDWASASFSRELNALSNMEHRNIVRLIGVGSDGMQRFLILEWLEETLEEYISAIGPIEWNNFYENIGRPILEALQYAHRRKCAHRDLKPLNVMFNAMRDPKITDFGIARATEDIRSGPTFAGAGSIPWTPAERDDGMYSERRDIYSWAAICIACLTGRLDYKSTADLRAAVARLGASTPQILLDCLSDSPASRPQSASTLLWILDDFHLDRLGKKSTPRFIGVEFPGQVQRRLAEFFGDIAESERVTRCLADLADNCEVSRGSDGELDFVGATLSLRAARGSLDSPWLTVSEIRLATAKPPSTFSIRAGIRFIDRASSTVPISELRGNANFLDAFLATAGEKAEEEQKRRDEERYLTLLQDIVAARMRALRELPAIPYHSGRWEGGEFRASIPQQALLKPGEKRVIRTPGAILVFEVARREGRTVFFRLVGQRRQAIAAEGSLRADTLAQRRSLERQEDAVKSLRGDMAVMPALKRIILKPGQTETPEAGGREALEGLSVDKAAVIDAALGLRQMLVVIGPPGTGKTTLITAVVNQYLRENPGARVLLAAQTHVAIDHVISKLLNVPELSGRVVRIARTDEEKVSESVRSVLLDRCLVSWCEAAAQKSREFASARGNAVGLRSSDVELAIRVEALRRACETEGAKAGMRGEAQKKLDAAQSDALSAPDDDLIDVESATVATLSVAELDEEIARLNERIVRLRQELRQLGSDGEALANLAISELQEWTPILEQADESWLRFRSELELQVGWLDLLGQLKQFEEVVLRGAAVVAGTCVGLGSTEAFSSTRFDLCIIDEASKAAATEALIPMVRSAKCLIVGDPKQLPPYEGDPVYVEGYTADEVKETLLDYLVPKLPTSCVLQLTHQHRMCASIGDLISKVFYSDSLVNDRLDTDRPDWICKKFRKAVVWMDTANAPQRRQGTTYVNLHEQDVILELLKTLQHGSSRAKSTSTVSVIAGYAAQASALDSRIQRDSFSALSIEVATVDSFQGRESDICIFSVTLSNTTDFLGFLRSMKRLNVALSRPKDLLVIVGDQSFCYQAQGENPFVAVIDYIETHPNTCETKNASK